MINVYYVNRVISNGYDIKISKNTKKSQKFYFINSIIMTKKMNNIFCSHAITQPIGKLDG